MGNVLSQIFFIPAPSFTEENLPDQTGKVHIVTGGYGGVGFELVKFLYQKNATVFIAGRNRDKGAEAVVAIQQQYPYSAGKLEFLYLDLADLSSIKGAADEFMSKSDRLDVLTNNAGVMAPPKGSETKQGHDLQMGTNCLGPFLFTRCLLPLLKATATSSHDGSVRITWATSLAADAKSPRGGVDMAEDGKPKLSDPSTNYGATKAGNIFLAAECARRYGKDGIISVAWNPGNLKTELERHIPTHQKLLLSFILYPAVYGAYTELYAGWSPDISLKTNGAYIMPWGRLGRYRKDIVAGSKSISEGGKGTAEKFWGWCERETQRFASPVGT